jgi:hypothetical protein
MLHRLRVLDVATPWFWFVIFWYGPRYGDSMADAHLHEGPNWCRGWFHIWQWEDVPLHLGAAVEGKAG